MPAIGANGGIQRGARLPGSAAPKVAAPPPSVPRSALPALANRIGSSPTAPQTPLHAVVARRMAEKTTAPSTPAPRSVAHRLAAKIASSHKGSQYVNPLKNVHGLRAARVDQGVDYFGRGPVGAIADGKILQTVGSGHGVSWPGTRGPGRGAFIEERIASGPYAGKDWYYAEGVRPTVAPGQQVKAGQRIGVMLPGEPGIETGWSAGDKGRTLAMALQKQGSPEYPLPGTGQHWSSATGASANRLLARLGAPSGNLQGTAVGEVPAGYPAPAPFFGPLAHRLRQTFQY